MLSTLWNSNDQDTLYNRYRNFVNNSKVAGLQIRLIMGKMKNLNLKNLNPFLADYITCLGGFRV